MLFFVAITRKPTKKQEEDGKLEEILLEPKVIVAKDDKSAAMKAIIDGRDRIGDDMERVEVHVRPF